jgi:hypothetical protein
MVAELLAYWRKIAAKVRKTREETRRLFERQTRYGSSSRTSSPHSGAAKLIEPTPAPEPWLNTRRNFAAEQDGELFDQNVLRNRTDYQFTREHAARSIVEYNTLSRRARVSLLYTAEHVHLHRVR